MFLAPPDAATAPRVVYLGQGKCGGQGGCGGACENLNGSAQDAPHPGDAAVPDSPQ